MRKLVAVSLLLLTALSGVFAGGGSDSGSGGEKKPVVINMWTHEDPNRQKMEEQFAKEYMAANPHVTINYSVYPSTNIQDLIPTAYAARNAPSIWNLELQKAYPIFMQGLCAPIPVKELGYRNEQELINSYLPGMLDPVMDKDGKLFGQKGAIYGLPLEMVNFCIYLNKKIFRDAGLNPERDYPKTWEEMMTVSEKIVRRNGNIITRRGFDFRYGDYLISWVPMVEQLGGKVISDDGKEAIINEAAWTKVLTYMQQWGPNGKNLGSPTYTAARRQFDNDQNEIAMHLSGIYQEARMRTANPAFYNSDDWMVIPYPVFQGGKHISNTYYFQYYMVNSQIPLNEQIESWKFVAYMLSHGDMYLETVALTQPTKAVMEGELFRSMPYSDVFKDDLNYAGVVYHSGFSWRINELIKAAIEEVMMSNSDPAAAVAKLKRDAQAVVNENL
ncbi:ABC transporter substrate-binding protein [Breznakiella homolactica]|uniref:Extracellular solute-binding protein n=1 Tax=Breznakiella homolactica TaxID=2798577 RepID=A0A7T8BBY7_9SPIR|nr:extracellular solute-binding protein [Breznakiella homolactica]QQO10580.1 extracellular solute-binding protein [Breznakiella homolactica]